MGYSYFFLECATLTVAALTIIIIPLELLVIGHGFQISVGMYHKFCRKKFSCYIVLVGYLHFSESNVYQHHQSLCIYGSFDINYTHIIAYYMRNSLAATN